VQLSEECQATLSSDSLYLIYTDLYEYVAIINRCVEEFANSCEGKFYFFFRMEF